MSANYLWGALLGLLPLTGFAQDAPRLYLGAGAVLMRFAPFESYATTYVGPAGTLGVRFNPNWALEAGGQATWDTKVYTGSYFNGSGQSISTTTVKSSTWIVPLLARYTFGTPETRLHADALGGISLLFSSSEVETVNQTQGRITSNGSRNSDSALSLVLGPQLRYTLGSAFDLKLNLPLSLNVSSKGSFGNRLFLTPQLGGQYTFGR